MRAPHESTQDQAWQEHRAKLYRFVLKRVQDEALAEDIVHDVLMKAHTRQETLRDARKLQSWLYQITRNTIIDHYRSQKPLEPMPDELIREHSEEDGRAQRELARCLVPLLNELPELYRRALTLAEFEGLAQREVASRLGLSLSGAKSRVQRARRMLYEVLLECCRVERDRRGGILDYEPRNGCDVRRGPQRTP